MKWQIVQAAGGLGLFLLGMIIMTEGLHGLAGGSLRHVLRRFTRSPASGAVTGALATAVVQSSSATTLSAVGFAGAGLLTFPQALGIVFGANVGTTVTGWMVVLFGFKLKLGLIMPTAVLVGVLLRLFGRGWIARVGYAVAGFGLLFTGIDALRAGMGGFEGVVTPELFPDGTPWGRLQLVGLGVLVTLVTQSSSAGVATSLVALSAGAIDWSQGAALVIGMDVGTTVTAALATVGASLPARRTGFAHVIFNLFASLGAFLFLPVFRMGLELVLPNAIETEPELSLVAFHTTFNLLGVSLAVPFAKPFGRLVERAVPDRPTPFTQRLERSLLSEPDMALTAVAPTLGELAQHGLAIVRDLLGARSGPGRVTERIELLTLASDEVRSYLGRMATCAPGSHAESRRSAALHVVDQMRRLLHRATQTERAARVSSSTSLRRLALRVSEVLPEDFEAPSESESALAEVRAELRDGRPVFRNRVIAEASDEGGVAEALEQMDAYRWLERVTHHAWRLTHHLGQLQSEAPTESDGEPVEPE